MANGNGWTKYEKLVLHEIERLNDGLESIKQEISGLRSEITLIKIKFASISAGIALLTTFVMQWIIDKL